MKRVYVIALVGALLVFATAMLMKTPAVKDYNEVVTGDVIPTASEESESSTKEVTKEKTTEPTQSGTVSVKSSASDSTVIDSVTDAVISDTISDNNSLNSESNDTSAISADLQNYDQVKTSSYDY